MHNLWVFLAGTCGQPMDDLHSWGALAGGVVGVVIVCGHWDVLVVVTCRLAWCWVVLMVVVAILVAFIKNPL